MTAVETSDKLVSDLYASISSTPKILLELRNSPWQPVMLLSDAEFKTEFERALVQRHFRPYFQPIISLTDGRIVGFEVLARWLGFESDLTPSIFIPRAEQLSLLDDLLDSIVDHAFDAASKWTSHAFLSINVSPTQIVKCRLPELLSVRARQHSFPLERVKIEITENALMSDLDATIAAIQTLTDMGCAMAIDDFGSGFTSLSNLAALSVDMIKVDQSFVKSISTNRKSRKILSAIAGLSRSLNLTVIAEGVETEAQAEILRRVGYDYVQGFLYCKPLPAEQVPAILSERRRFHGDAGGHGMSPGQRAQQMTALYRSDNAILAFADPALIIVEASEQFAQLLGRALKDVVGQHLYQVIPPDPDRIGLLRSYKARGLPYPTVNVVLPSGGSADMAVHVVADEVGDILGHSILVMCSPAAQQSALHEQSFRCGTTAG